jgi:hypothetical protein
MHKMVNLQLCSIHLLSARPIIFKDNFKTRFTKFISSPLDISQTFGTSHIYKSGPGSVDGIATAYGLDGPGIKSRWGARFSAPVHTGPEAHPASCTMGTESFPGVRCGRGGGDSDPPPPSSAEVKNRVEVYLYSP